MKQIWAICNPLEVVDRGSETQLQDTSETQQVGKYIFFQLSASKV